MIYDNSFGRKIYATIVSIGIISFIEITHEMIYHYYSLINSSLPNEDTLKKKKKHIWIAVNIPLLFILRNILQRINAKLLIYHSYISYEFTNTLEVSLFFVEMGNKSKSKHIFIKL